MNKTIEDFAGSQIIEQCESLPTGNHRTNKLNMEESLILADCIVKGMYQAGKTVVVA